MFLVPEVPKIPSGPGPADPSSASPGSGELSDEEDAQAIIPGSCWINQEQGWDVTPRPSHRSCGSSSS